MEVPMCSGGGGYFILVGRKTYKNGDGGNNFFPATLIFLHHRWGIIFFGAEIIFLQKFACFFAKFLQFHFSSVGEHSPQMNP